MFVAVEWFRSDPSFEPALAVLGCAGTCLGIERVRTSPIVFLRDLAIVFYGTASGATVAWCVLRLTGRDGNVRSWLATTVLFLGVAVGFWSGSTIAARRSSTEDDIQPAKFLAVGLWGGFSLMMFKIALDYFGWPIPPPVWTESGIDEYAAAGIFVFGILSGWATSK